MRLDVLKRNQGVFTHTGISLQDRRRRLRRNIFLASVPQCFSVYLISFNVRQKNHSSDELCRAQLDTAKKVFMAKPVGHRVYRATSEILVYLPQHALKNEAMKRINNFSRKQNFCKVQNQKASIQ